jgi:Immunoglobulin I-set domain/Immunoglobulin domain
LTFYFKKCFEHILIPSICFLTGRESPVIELFPKEPQTLRVGESTRFSCRSTSGTPQPTIVWVRRDGQPLSSRFTEDYPGVITLREAKIDDAGVYECRASNIAGETSLSTTLEIQQQPSISIVPDRERIDLTEGDELRFTCLATGIPAPSIQIKFPDSAEGIAPARSTEVRRDQSEATLAHFGVQQSQAGNYECIATNDAGQDIKYIQVTVAEKRGDVGMI